MLKNAGIQYQKHGYYGRKSAHLKLGKLSYEDLIQIAQAEGLMTESEAKVFGDLKKLHDRLEAVDKNQTPRAIEAKLSKFDGKDLTPKEAFEANVISLNAYRLLLSKLDQELREKRIRHHSSLSKQLDALAKEVNDTHSTLKMMCDLGHLKHRNLFHPGEVQK